MLASRSWRGGRGERFGNPHQDAIRFFKNLIIPEPQHSVAQPLKPGCAALISIAFGVLAAIQLDYEARRLADKIDYIATDRLLPPPLAPKPISAQFTPQPPLGIGHILPQALGPRQRQGRVTTQATSPSGASTSALNACISSAPVAPSMARWSKLPVAVITDAMASASSTT